MRLHAWHHVSGITLLVLYVLFRLRMVLSTVLEPWSPHVLSREALAEGSPRHENRTEYIPRIIHQVYLGWDNREMPEEWEEMRQSCIEMHPDYEYMV